VSDWQPGPKEHATDRFKAFNPEEREILRCLLEAHANAVSQIAIAIDVRPSEYLLYIERLESEVKQV